MCTFKHTTKATRTRRACRLRSHDFECDVLIIDTDLCKEYGEPVASGKLAFLPVIFCVPITREQLSTLLRQREESLSHPLDLLLLFDLLSLVFFHPPCIVCSPLVSLARSLRPVSVLLACPFFHMFPSPSSFCTRSRLHSGSLFSIANRSS